MHTVTKGLCPIPLAILQVRKIDHLDKYNFMLILNFSFNLSMTSMTLLKSNNRFSVLSLCFFCCLRVPQGLSIKLNFTSFETQPYADVLSIFEGLGQNKILRGKFILQLIRLKSKR